MAGLTPKNGDEVNNVVGVILRQFVDIKESVNHLQANLAPLVLTDAPYNLAPADETLIKSAVNSLDASLDAVDMTFISRLAGSW